MVLRTNNSENQTIASTSILDALSRTKVEEQSSLKSFLLINEEEYFESKRDLWEIAKTHVEGKENCSKVVPPKG